MFTVTGGTYAYFAFSAKNENTITGTAATTGLNLVVERKLPTNVGVMVPQLESGLGSAISTTYSCIDGNNNTVCQVYKATVTNNGTGSVELNGTIKFSGIDNMPNLKWKRITDERTIGEYTSKKASTSNVIFDSNKVLTPNESDTYYFVIWIDETGTTQTDSGTFKVTIEFNPANGDGLTSTIGVTNIENIVEDVFEKEAINDASLDFSKTSEESNTNGIYLRNGTENDTYPIYYYRGAVDNNLIFADNCWKIVRTTETGGLKLIYNGLPSNGQCNNTGEATIISDKKFNENDNSLSDAGYMYGTVYEINYNDMSSGTDTYIYGNDITYSNGKYTLINTITNLSWDWETLFNNGGLNNNHYTCFTNGTTCENVYYIYNVNSLSALEAYYITLINGKKVEDALIEMLGTDDNNAINYNAVSSTIKGNITTEGTLDYWYYTNIEQKGYSSYIEDTVWCNDRSISSLGGWNPNGGNVFYQLSFSSLDRVYNASPSLICNRNVDSFTVSEANGNGDLDYPVGLLTADEITLAGGKNGRNNNTYYLYNAASNYIGSITPFNFGCCGVPYKIGKAAIDTWGNLVVSNGGTISVRPSISLKSGFTLTGDGDGSVTNPYVVE